jgi:hypothetical protein
MRGIGPHAFLNPVLGLKTMRPLDAQGSVQRPRWEGEGKKGLLLD